MAQVTLWLHLSIPPLQTKGENSLESLISLSALLFVGIFKNTGPDSVRLKQSKLSIAFQYRTQLIRNNFQSLFMCSTSTVRAQRGAYSAWHEQCTNPTEQPWHLHVSIPALVSAVKISPAGSILDRHEWLLQVTQHGNHIVLDGACCIIGLQKIWTFKQDVWKTTTKKEGFLLWGSERRQVSLLRGTSDMWVHHSHLSDQPAFYWFGLFF